jgi:hypothetical protein
MAYRKEMVEIDGEEQAVYSSGKFDEDKNCSHHFKRVSPYKVECTKCHVGFFDSPDSPFPISELNMYYQIPEVKKYNQWL